MGRIRSGLNSANTGQYYSISDGLSFRQRPWRREVAEVPCPQKMLPDTDQKLVGVYDLILVSWPFWFAAEVRPLKAIQNESLLEKKNFEVSCTTFDWSGRPPT